MIILCCCSLNIKILLTEYTKVVQINTGFHIILHHTFFTAVTMNDFLWQAVITCIEVLDCNLCFITRKLKLCAAGLQIIEPNACI